MHDKLHVGCGPCYIDGFFNIDLRDDVKTDYCGSLFDLVYKDNSDYIAPSSVNMIWSCHMLEHLSYPVGVKSCLEVFNGWLKPGGLLRLALPDLALIISYYISKDKKLFELFGDTVDHEYYKMDSQAERVQFFMRGWEHSIVFDFNLINALLKDAGFKNIKKMNFMESKLGQWEHDRFEIESMYVECEK